MRLKKSEKEGMVVCKFPPKKVDECNYCIAVNGRWVYYSFDGKDAHVPAEEGDRVLLAYIPKSDENDKDKPMGWYGEYIVKF